MSAFNFAAFQLVFIPLLRADIQAGWNWYYFLHLHAEIVGQLMDHQEHTEESSDLILLTPSFRVLGGPQFLHDDEGSNIIMF